MGPITISERFTSQCSPVISSNYDTTGTVTRSTINHLSASDLRNLFAPDGLFADLDAWFFHSIEMKACGIKRNTWYDWIMANSDMTKGRAALSGTKTMRGGSLLHPFIFGRQMSVTNKEHWAVSTGWANSAYTALTTGPLSSAQKALGAAGDRIVRLISRYSIPTDPKFFNSKESIHLFGTSATGQTEHGQWSILAAAADDALSYVDVLVTSLNAGSTTPYDTAPTVGYVVKGINNVDDYESWCNNAPTIDPRKRVPFWLQTRRRTRSVDDEYKKVYARLLESNPAFAEFGDLPMAERNRQDEEKDQHEFVHAFLFNKPRPNQTVELWENLETINTIAGAVLDPGLSGKPVAKRANFVGVYEQLRACARTYDLHGQVLNLYEWLELCYNLVRARKSSSLGKPVKELDWWTNSTFQANFATGVMQYYEDEYLDQYRVTAQLGKTSELGFTYDGWYFKRPSGVKMNIMSDEFFDDYADNLNYTGDTASGNLFLCLDIGKPGVGSIYYAMTAANRKVHRTASIEELAKYDATYRCTMETTAIETTLISEQGTVVVEAPLNNAWIANFSSAAPSTAAADGLLSDLY